MRAYEQKVRELVDRAYHEYAQTPQLDQLVVVETEVAVQLNGIREALEAIAAIEQKRFNELGR